MIALSPFYILIYIFQEMMHDRLGVFHANQTSMCLDANWTKGEFVAPLKPG